MLLLIISSRRNSCGSRTAITDVNSPPPLDAPADCAHRVARRHAQGSPHAHSWAQLRLHRDYALHRHFVFFLLGTLSPRSVCLISCCCCFFVMDDRTDMEGSYIRYQCVCCCSCFFVLIVIGWVETNGASIKPATTGDKRGHRWRRRALTCLHGHYEPPPAMPVIGLHNCPLNPMLTEEAFLVAKFLIGGLRI